MQIYDSVRKASLFVGVLIMLSSFSGQVLAEMLTTLKTMTSQGQTFGKGIQFLEDAESTLTFPDVSKETLNWQTNHETVFNKGYSYSTWWLRFSLENTELNNDWILEISYAVLDNIDVHIIFEDGTTRKYSVGDHLPFSSRPIPHRNFLIPIVLNNQEKATIYIRLKTSSSSQLPMALWSNASFTVSDIKHTLVEGIWVGGLLTIALYNVLMFLVLRSREQLFYIANVISALMFVICIKGWGYQYLWPNSISWNDKSALFFLNMILLSSWLFTTGFLNVYSLSRTFERVQKAGLTVIIMLIPVMYYAEYSIAIRIIIPLSVVACLWGFTCGIDAWRKGNQSARYYLLAWSLFLCGGVIMALNKYHVIPQNVLTNFSFQIGSLFEILLFSLALADRINRERALRLKAEQDALSAQRKTNDTLEKHVKKRTQELQLANQKLEELSHTDQLLGIYNRRYLEKSLDTIYTSSLRQRCSMAILLIDVDHFKAINDAHGHLIGDECLKEVTKRIAQQVRLPEDVLTRYGGEEFCAVLPNTEFNDAIKIGERIRKCVAKNPIPTSIGAIDVSVSVGVSVSIPNKDCRPNYYLDLADTALYKAKASGRNRVIHGECLKY